MESNKLLMSGRTYFDAKTGVYYFNWSNAGFCVKLIGEWIEAEFYLPDNTPIEYKPWIKVYLDGDLIANIEITESGVYRLAEGLSPNQFHVIRVVKRTEAGMSRFGLKDIRLSHGGKLCEPDKPKNRRIEIIGDSITCGYGNIASSDQTLFQARDEDSTLSYGSFLGERFDADVRLICGSGKGLVMSNLQDTHQLLPELFTLEDIYTGQMHDFTGWQPDVLIINIGTNDVSQGVNPQEFYDTGIRFLKKIRKVYAKTAVIWTYGNMNDDFCSTIEQITEAWKQEDEKICFVPLEKCENIPDGVGSLGHPSVEGHRYLATQLFEKIKTYTRWE